MTFVCFATLSSFSSAPHQLLVFCTALHRIGLVDQSNMLAICVDNVNVFYSTCSTPLLSLHLTLSPMLPRWK